MINKMPVVGKRYRLKNYKAEVINVDSEGVTYLQGDKKYWDFLDDFRDYFEELPEDKAETKNTQKQFMSKEEEVKEKEESIWKSVSELPEDSYTVIIKAKGGYEEIFFGAYREDTQHFMDEAMKFVYPKKSIDKYCTLTDFINDYEKLKERVRKLEGK